MAGLTIEEALRDLYNTPAFIMDQDGKLSNADIGKIHQFLDVVKESHMEFAQMEDIFCVYHGQQLINAEVALRVINLIMPNDAQRADVQKAFVRDIAGEAAVGAEDN